MTRGRSGAALALLAALGLLAALAGAVPPGAAHASALAVEGPRGDWRTFWRSAAAPARWGAPEPALAGALRWRALAPGVELAQVRLAAPGLAWRTRLVVARVDPARVQFDLDLRLSPDRAHPAWSIEAADSSALLAVNAGQFGAVLPWGWLVQQGEERLSPGPGPLSLAFVVDRAGRARWVPGDSIATDSAARVRDTWLAFQSYPALLWHDGEEPAALREPGHGVDLAHRDARLALGELRDGRLVVGLTRFDALGEVAGQAPVGLTTPEMAAVMGALGCRTAVMLDGGISAQLLAREVKGGRVGRVGHWPGLRRVPLGLTVRARALPGPRGVGGGP